MRKELLDHGYVELCEAWGSDEDIIRAARQSTQKGFLGWGDGDDGGKCETCGESDVERRNGRCRGEPGSSHVWSPYVGDEKLLKFLWDNRHSTPFEFAGATFEVKAPIFVFREWHRHRTQSYSEASARYAPLPDENYVPTVERMLEVSKANRQAGALKGSRELTEVAAVAVYGMMQDFYALAEVHYQKFLNLGVPKEVARVVLPVGRYSTMRASTDLRNWLGFLDLRLAPNAQWEIRQYATAVASMLESKFPRTMSLFNESRAR